MNLADINTSVPGTANYVPGGGDKQQRDMLTYLLLMQNGVMPPSASPYETADPSDPTSEVALDAVANPTANDIVSGRGFGALANPDPADVAAANAASPATNAQAAAIAAAINAGYNMGQPGYDDQSGSPAAQAANPGFNADPSSMAAANNSMGFSQGPGFNNGSPGYEDAGSLGALAAAMGQMQGGYANTATNTSSKGDFNATAPDQLAGDLNGPGWDASEPGGTIVGGPVGRGSSVAANQGTPSTGRLGDNDVDTAAMSQANNAMNDNVSSALAGVLAGYDTSGAPGVGLNGGNSTDANAGPGTGYGGNTVGYCGDIAGGLGTGFGTGTGPDAGLGFSAGFSAGFDAGAAVNGGPNDAGDGSDSGNDAGAGGDGSGGDGGK